MGFVENIPIVYINGDGYSAWFQHGNLLQKEIHETVDYLKEKIFKTKTVNGFLLYTYFVGKAKQLDKQIPQIYREEMSGIADSANVSYIDILFINTYDDLLNLSGCSSIAGTKNDINSLFFHARNLDYTIDFLANKNVVFHNQTSGVISVGFPWYIGTLSATNYSGLSLSSHTSSSHNNTIGVPTGILYRKIIDEAKTINDAENILKNTRKTIGNNLLVSSLRENKITIFEITADKTISINNQKYAVATNHFVSPELSLADDTGTNSHKRHSYLNDFYQNTPQLQITDLIKMMSFYDGGNKGWSSVANKWTIQSIIFIPESGRVYIAKGIQTPVTKDWYISYDYSKFLPSEL